MKIRSTLAAFAVCGLLPFGCATYVNIPPRAGDVAVHDVNQKAVQNVVVAATRAAIAERPIDGQFQVVLPRGTEPLTYDKVLPRISPHAYWSSEGRREGVPVVEVREVRIRGSRAEADIIRPWNPADTEGFRNLTTVELTWDPVSQWQPEHVTHWHGMTVEDALRTKPHEPPPDITR